MRPSNQFLTHGTVHPSNPYLSNSPRTSPDCHDFSNIMESDLATTPANSLRALGCISSGPIDICPSTGEVWEERLPVKTEAKKLLSTSAFSSSNVTSLPVVFIRGYAFFDLPFLTDIPVEALIILCIPGQVQLQLCIGLPDPIPTLPGSVPILFPGYLSLLPLPGPDFTLYLTHIPQDCELHQCMITAAQAASNLDITNQLTCVGDQQVQYRIPSDYNGEVIWLSGYGLYLPRRSPSGPSEVEGHESVTDTLHNRLGSVAQHFLPPYLFSKILHVFGPEITACCDISLGTTQLMKTDQMRPMPCA
ncbi:hypothetical protein QYF61_016279 [Mycteria americana]|uniref:Uncharacterized protein n=1 Tax=Mycteria americana TaxID=33587 RepID=A0AAN7MZ61_MYCAM|nr:hypothetical protein QYF61_016279 [Mycteria americana]